MEALDAGGQGGGLLTEPHRIGRELAMLGRAVRNDWPVPDDVRPAIIERLVTIAQTDDDPRNSNKAAEILMRMTGMRMTDLHHLESLSTPKSGTTVNVAVQVKVVKGECWEGA